MTLNFLFISIYLFMFSSKKSEAGYSIGYDYLKSNSKQNIFSETFWSQNFKMSSPEGKLLSSLKSTPYSKPTLSPSKISWLNLSGLEESFILFIKLWKLFIFQFDFFFIWIWCLALDINLFKIFVFYLILLCCWRKIVNLTGAARCPAGLRRGWMAMYRVSDFQWELESLFNITFLIVSVKLF